MNEKKLKKKLKKAHWKLNIIGQSQVKVIEELERVAEAQAILQAVVVSVGKHAGLEQDEFLQIVSECIDTVKALDEEYPTDADKAVRVAELLAGLQKGEARVH